MNSEALQNKKKTILSLQALRAIACLIIYIYHATCSGVFLAFGLSAVSMFFILSGFVMTISYWDRPVATTFKGAVEFSVRKMKPLFCLHVMMLFVGLVRELITPEKSVFSYIYELAITIPMVQTLFPVGYQALNSVDWYLSATMILYCVFPFLLRFLRQQRASLGKYIGMMTGVWLLMLAVGALVGFVFPRHTTWITKDHPFYRLGDFFIGCVLGTIYKGRKAKSGSIASSTVLELSAVIGVCVSVYLGVTVFENDRWLTNACLFIPSAACLIYCMACEGGLISRIITNPFTIYLSKISACFFLIHRQTLLYISFGLQRLFSIKLNGWVLALVGFPVTILLIHLYLYLEKKIKNRNGRILAKRQVRSARK